MDTENFYSLIPDIIGLFENKNKKKEKKLKKISTLGDLNPRPLD